MERLVVKFTKTSGTKFLSHLDTMRTLHRAMRRALIPIEYSKGFNPHPSISVAAPLSLGVESIAEYVDIELKEEMSTEEFKNRLNKNLPQGMEILKVVHIKEKMPSSMAAVDYAKYSIKLQHNSDKDTVEKIIEKIIQSEEILRMKKTKSGEKMTDIRPLIKDVELASIDNENVEIECILHTGSKGTLGAEMLSNVIKDYSDGCIFGYAYVKRREIYGVKNNKIQPLSVYFLGN